MTDRIRHVTITLDRDYRDDDVEVILSAIKMIKGVAKVQPKIVDVPDLLARAAVQADLEGKVYEAVHAVFEGARKGQANR